MSSSQDLKHVVELTQDRALGLEMNDEEAENLVQKGADIRHSKDVKDLKWVRFLWPYGALF